MTSIASSETANAREKSKVWKQWSGAGMQPPSLWYQLHPYRHHHPDIITPTSPPRHIELLPCKVWKQWSGAGCSRPHSGTSHTHPDIITSSPGNQDAAPHTKQPPSLWYQSHPYRHHHPDITTPTSPPRHHHPDTSSYYPARYGSNGAGQGAAALDNSLAPVAALIHPDIITPAHHPRHTEQSPCKVWKLTRCRRNGVQGAATRHEISGAG